MSQDFDRRPIFQSAIILSTFIPREDRSLVPLRNGMARSLLLSNLVDNGDDIEQPRRLGIGEKDKTLLTRLNE